MRRRGEMTKGGGRMKRWRGLAVGDTLASLRDKIPAAKCQRCGPCHLVSRYCLRKCGLHVWPRTSFASQKLETGSGHSPLRLLQLPLLAADPSTTSSSRRHDAGRYFHRRQRQLHQQPR